MSQLSKKNKKFSKNNKENLENKIITFDVVISNVEPINSEFSKALVKVMYADGNRNGSYFDKDMIINKMIPTIFNIPVVGHYLESEEDFGSHDSKIEITSNGDVNFIDETVPYGVVNENSEISWQLITEENGTIHDYLCCTCILWTGRYPQVQRVIDEGNNQSMEVNVLDGYDDENDGLFHVTDAEFSALTILGEDVEPCFESSSIEKYSLDKFKKDFSLMLKEIKNSLNSELKDNNSSNFDLNKNVKNKKEDKYMTKTEIAKKFALTYEQLEDEIRRVLSTVTYICDDYWYGEAWECRKYYLEDFDDQFIYAYNCEKDIYEKIPYSKQGDDVVADFSKASRVKTQFVDWVGATPEGDEPVEPEIDAMGEMEMSLKEKYTAKAEKLIETKVNEATTTKETELTADFEAKLTEKDTTINDLTEKFNKTNESLEELKSYKLKKENDEKEAKFAEYADELSEDEIKPIKEKMAEYDLTTIDEKLKIVFANKNHKPSKNATPKFNGMGVENFDWNNDDSKSKTDEDVWTRLEKNKKNN